MIHLTAEICIFDMLFEMHFEYREFVWNAWFFKHREVDNTLLHIQSKQQYKRSFAWHKQFEIEKYQFQLPSWRFIDHNFIVALSDIIPFYVTNTPILTLQFVASFRKHSELINYRAHKNSSFSLHGWSACISEFLQSSLQIVWIWNILLHKTEEFLSFSLHNVCTIAQQYIRTNTGLWTEKLRKKYEVNLSYLKLNSVYALTWKILSNQTTN